MAQTAQTNGSLHGWTSSRTGGLEPLGPAEDAGFIAVGADQLQAHRAVVDETGGDRDGQMPVRLNAQVSDTFSRALGPSLP